MKKSKVYSRSDRDQQTPVCPRCGENTTIDKRYISEGYFCACKSCDEDFYSFEVERDFER